MSGSRGRDVLRFLSARQIAILYEVHVARSGPTQPTMLQSAADSPQNNSHYGEKDLFRLAGILAERIMLNHAFSDGNKRTALLAGDMFLKLNGFRLEKKHDGDDEFDEGLKNAHVSVASKQWTADELASYYKDIAKPIVYSETRQYINGSDNDST
jgi:death-on-curing family protein